MPDELTTNFEKARRDVHTALASLLGLRSVQVNQGARELEYAHARLQEVAFWVAKAARVYDRAQDRAYEYLNIGDDLDAGL
jgi:hypothetical protein